uniref:Alba domain-containing protein n=1 Tax=Angiostrongylus cantonensis TaxID=6313 RepID=A0A0K0D5V6_ANGCA
MDKYVISEEEDILDAEPPFDDFMKSGITIMELRKNTRFGNIINYVDNLFRNEVRRVIFRGVGDAAEKCVSCVEVFKRKRQVL